MKIKLDFVSNSSSTSFVYISDDELSEEAFLDAAGVDRSGPIADLFRQMHYQICSSIERTGKCITSLEAVEDISGTHKFTPDVIEKMKKAINRGQNVVTSTLDSDGELAESLMCISMFEIVSDSFYINAYNNYW